MKVKPVSHYNTPCYPDLDKSKLNPGLLKKTPRRWQYNQAVLAAITALTAMSMSSSKYEKSYNSKTESEIITSAGMSLIAPIFEHGQGTGSIGCVSIAPPAFMSEQEALAIIKNEALTAEINLEDIPEGYTVKPHKYSGDDDYLKNLIIGYPVSLEASDNDIGIAVSFISSGDARLHTTSDEMYSSVTDYMMKQRAEDAASDWAEEDLPYTVGTFYDPSLDYKKVLEIQGELFNDPSTYTEDNKILQQRINELMEEDLRAQVRDFIEWLRGQGII